MVSQSIGRKSGVTRAGTGAGGGLCTFADGRFKSLFVAIFTFRPIPRVVPSSKAPRRTLIRGVRRVSCHPRFASKTPCTPSFVCHRIPGTIPTASQAISQDQGQGSLNPDRRGVVHERFGHTENVLNYWVAMCSVSVLSLSRPHPAPRKSAVSHKSRFHASPKNQISPARWMSSDGWNLRSERP